VTDPNTVRRIVRLAGVTDGDRVLEIGGGVGSLTLALAESGADVTTVEVDRGLVPVLREVVAPHTGVEVIEGDALTLDLADLLATRSAGPWTVVANLPYNVATPVVLRLFDEVPAVGVALVMVQREVAERLAAGVGDTGYGAVSVRIAYWATASVVGRVPASVFYPRPRVESALVRIVRRPAPAVAPEDVAYDRLVTVVRAGFAHRRKTLRRSLAGVVRDEAFAAADVDDGARAEELSVEDWGRLAAQAAPA
jgi:16S rRNA (adenine1518-N6/adenine1519-N6)-dimethyltransferase